MSSAGLFTGFFHGLLAVFSLIADIVFDVTVYDHCQESWWYDLGFVVGLVLVGRVAFTVSLPVLAVVLVVGVVVAIFGSLIIFALFALIVALAVFFGEEVKAQLRQMRQKS